MIVIDTSAIVAILNDEPERIRFLEIIADADLRLISAVTMLETHFVTYSRFGPDGSAGVDRWLKMFEPEIVPFDLVQCQAAFEAFQIYGKGIRPGARLNFGDCAVYALAKTRRAPLLFKGSDFAATDISPAADRG